MARDKQNWSMNFKARSVLPMGDLTPAKKGAGHLVIYIFPVILHIIYIKELEVKYLFPVFYLIA